MDDNSEVVREVRDIPQWNLNPTLSVTCSVPQSFRTKIPKSSPPWRFCAIQRTTGLYCVNMRTFVGSIVLNIFICLLSSSDDVWTTFYTLGVVTG